MSGLNRNFGLTSSTAAEGIRLAITNSGQNFNSYRKPSGGIGGVVELPKRPDLTILNETIPLFYIAQNGRGFWVARDADGRCGGIFLLRRSATRFARIRSAPAGCAMMFVNEVLELDVGNEGSRFVELLSKAVDMARRRMPTLAAFVAMAVDEWRKLVAQLSRALAGERRNRAAIERDLFQGQYTLSSKNDDDLPIP